MKTHTSAAVFITTILLFALSACTIPLTEEKNAGGIGELELTIQGVGQKAAPRTLAPDIGTMIAKYAVLLQKPDTADVKANITGTKTVISDLTAGSWFVYVEARSSDGIRLAAGSTTVQIEPGSTNSATVTLTAAPDTSGSTGSVNVVVKFPEGEFDIGYCSADATFDDSPEDLQLSDPSVNGLWDFTFTKAEAAAGSHLLKMNFYGVNQDAYLTESVLVYPGVTTDVTLVYYPSTNEFKAAPLPPIDGSILLYDSYYDEYGYEPLPVQDLRLLAVDYQSDPPRNYPILAWRPVAGAFATGLNGGYYGYYIEKSNAADGDYVWVTDLGPYESSYIAYDWAPSVEDSYYRITVMNNFYESTPSTEVIQPAIPPNPTNIYVESSLIYWDSVDGAAGYNLYARDDTGVYTLLKGDMLAGGGTEGPFEYYFYNDLVALLPNKPYWIHVSAFINDGEGEFKAESDYRNEPAGYYSGSGSA